MNCLRMPAAVMAGFLAFTVFGPKTVFSAEQEESENTAEISAADSEGRQLFAPCQYLGVAAGTYRSAGGSAPDMLIRYYDSTGAFHGEALGMVDHFMGTFNIIEEGRLLYDYEDDDILFRRTEDFEEVCRCRRKDVYTGRAFAARDHIGILSEDGSHLFIYDREGQICAELKTEAPPAELSYEDWGERVNLVIYEPEGYLYIRLRKGEQTLLAALVREDGSVQTAGDTGFPDLFSGGRVCGYIGENLIVREEEDRYAIAGPEGDVLCSDVLLHWSKYGGYDHLGMTGAEDRADFAALREGTELRILDETLSEAGRIREEDLDAYGHIQYAGGTVIGLPCDELGGERSTDVLPYLRRTIPAAKVPGGYQIAEELGSFLPDPEEGWKLDSFSDDFMLVRNADAGMMRVLRREDGQILLETDQLVFLQNTSFVVEEDFMDPDSVTMIYDKNMKPLYSSEGRVFPCMDDWYFLHRGPWAGVTDAEGKWILRELQYDE